MKFDAQILASHVNAREQVSHGLNLKLVLEDPDAMPILLAGINAELAKTQAALKELHFVHFARFLPAPDNKALLVVTEFDGPLEPYVLDFVIAIHSVFNLILAFVHDRPPLPVQEHPREFMDFVKQNNTVVVIPGVLQYPDYPLYSAYPDLTVIDIVGPRSDLPPPVQEPARQVINQSDVQGNILRGYRAKLARHYAVTMATAQCGRDFLKEIISGNSAKWPQVTRGDLWDKRPGYFLNIGMTADGLRAIGLPQQMLSTLPTVFLEGPANAARAKANGDVDESAPYYWELGNPDQTVHFLVSLYGNDTVDGKAEFDMRASQLTALWRLYNIEVVSTHDATALGDGYVHFGYRDGIAQPRIEGIDDDAGADMQPHASVGEFLLGKNYTGIYGGKSIWNMPAALCENATFAAIRVLEQNVQEFENLLDKASRDGGLDRELIAAKLVGRWRDGTPLAQSAEAPRKDGCPHGHGDNNFDYAPSYEHSGVFNDHDGLQCPVGAHIRRMNPRSALVAGYPHSHRLIRRGMPYGPKWTGKRDGEKRGLFGMFICSDLDRQFEFLMQQWANGDIAASGIRGTQDPIIGAQNLDGTFLIPQTGAAQTVELKVPRLVTTRGSLYLLVPGIAGLRFLGEGKDFVDAPPAGPGANRNVPGPKNASQFDPSTFNPRAKSFLLDPYPDYARFRDNAPVALVKTGSYASYWVFSHELVTEVCDRQDVFLKQAPSTGNAKDRGLFMMDPPRHGEVRPILDGLFAKAIANVQAIAHRMAIDTLTDIGNRSSREFDLVKDYTNKVTRNIFMKIFGMPEKWWGIAGGLVNTVLMHFDEMSQALSRAPAALASLALLSGFRLEQSRCPAHGGAPGLLCMMESQGKAGGMTETEVTQSALHFALGGYLSSDFLVATGMYNLLKRPADLRAFVAGSAQYQLNAIEEMKRFDAPFQMADRVAAKQVELGGVVIPANAQVTVIYGSANHDDKVFGSTAENFIPARNFGPAGDIYTKKNYVFGHGIHFCIGEPLVKSIIPILINELFLRMPNLALKPDSEKWVPDPYFRGFSSLIVTF